jgi:hypothetical protein
MFNLALMLQDGPSQEAIRNIMMTMIPIIMIAMIVGLAVLIIPFWFICKKAGFSPWLSFLNVIPFGHLILIYVLAFADWNVAPVPQAAWQALPPSPPPPPPLQPPTTPPQS